ncbi:ATPase [Capnocytophaga gingivalis]|jgi:YD repeat protein|uniref:ATPase n=1 Tax=Capnocytophaga gingivalis TaxID=1017 RepID=A0A250FQ28_9FLAO|nr:ATPase [Capnocytophaga gingivalis]ATA86168.1 ATPase [Capnocytophaga gingivalis]
MKHLLIPFLFITTVIVAQNTANKVEKYKIDSDLAYPFEKPLLGKVKKVHTAHYSTVVTVLKDTIKREHFVENYTYGFDERGNEIEFIKYDKEGNIWNKEIKKYNEKDRLLYSKETKILGEDETYIEENSYSYNDKGFLIEEKSYEEDPDTGISHRRELYKYNNDQKLIENSYYSNDSLKRQVLYWYDNKGNLLRKLFYLDNKPYTDTKFEYNHIGNLIKKTENYIKTDYKHVKQYEYDAKNRLILFTKEDDDTKEIILKIIYKDDLLIEIYDNRDDEEVHIFYSYKNKKLINKVISKSFFNGCYYDYIKEKILYDEKGRIKKSFDYKQNKIKKTYTYYYDNKDRVIKTELLYTGDKKEYWIDNYDTIGNLIETIYKNDDYRDKDSYTYDNNNNLLSKITYKGNKAIEKTFYTYDKYQNIIKIEKYNNGKNYIYERTFTYYE